MIMTIWCALIMSIVVDIKHHARAQVSNSIVVPMVTALYGEEDSRYGKHQYQTMIPPLQGLYTIVMCPMDTVGGVMSIMILFWRWGHVNNGGSCQ